MCVELCDLDDVWMMLMMEEKVDGWVRGDINTEESFKSLDVRWRGTRTGTRGGLSIVLFLRTRMMAAG